VGGDAEIEEHAIDLADAECIEEWADLGEVPFEGLKFSSVRTDVTFSVSEGGGILIDAYDIGTGREERGTVTTCAKSAVDDEPARCWSEEAKNFFE
jgi:hypothetical protein